MDLDRLIGDETTFPLEHRILNTVLLMCIGITLFAFWSDLLLGLYTSAVINAVSSILSGLLYYASVVKRAYRTALRAALVFAFCVLPVVWYANAGINGGTTFIVLVLGAMITISVREARSIFILVGCLAVETLALMAGEYLHPHLVQEYDSPAFLYADRFVGLTIALVVITSLYVIILNFYRREHRRATDYRVRIEKQVTALEMARLDRLNLIGEMAASIGHEVRNPLTTIRGFLQLFRNKPEYERHREHFDMMIGELDRANSIITEFLSLAKNKAVTLEPCDLNAVLQRIFPLIQAGALETGKDIILKPRKLPLIEADEREMRQLVLNLASNALDATEPGGTVKIGTYREKCQAVLFVSDTGQGIPTEILAKLGTPFLTTKEKGTGLGLAICYRIAERHKAKVEVATGPQGTTFRFRFAVLRPTKPLVTM